LPQYYNQEKYLDVGRIRISPVPWWRKIWLIKYYFPYFVGDRVRLRLQIENPLSLQTIYELFGGSQHSAYALKADQIITGSIINAEGDVEYRLSTRGYSKEGIPIFTTRAINKDRWGLAFVGLLLGAILTFICSILMALLQIVPFWKVWIP